jgi:hypothetical protein
MRSNGLLSGRVSSTRWRRLSIEPLVFLPPALRCVMSLPSLVLAGSL